MAGSRTLGSSASGISNSGLTRRVALYEEYSRSKWLSPVATDSSIVSANQLVHGARCVHRADGLESDPDHSTLGIPFDDLVVRRLPVPAVGRKIPVKGLMELLDDPHRDGDIRCALVDEIQDIAVAGDLLLGSVSRRGGLEDDSLDAFVRRDDPLDPV